MGPGGEGFYLWLFMLCSAGDPSSISRFGRFPEEHGYPLQYSCLENPMDKGGWWATAHGVAKSWTQQSDSHFHALESMV